MVTLLREHSSQSAPGRTDRASAGYLVHALLSAAPCRSRGAIARIAVFSELARRTLATAGPPFVRLAVAEIAGVRSLDDDVEQRFPAEFLRHREGRGLVDPP